MPRPNGAIGVRVVAVESAQEVANDLQIPGWVLGLIGDFYGSEWPPELAEWLFHPQGPEGKLPADGFEILERSAYVAPEWLYPVSQVDEVSIACVVLTDVPERSVSAGSVVRWFVSDVSAEFQLAILDIALDSYLESMVAELTTRDAGLKRMMYEIGPAYEESHIINSKRPRDYVVRPVRIACQNVIVGLAAISQESSFDGLSVVAWQTCEVPHVATNEANRALAALTLCDAFQNGGTMGDSV